MTAARNERALVSEAGRAFGISPSAADTAALLAYAGHLLRWNRRINLTGARTVEDVVLDHFPDAFALSALVPAGARVVDVGSGGGLPAIPFAIWRRDCEVTMIESRAKRAAFLRDAVREARINVAVIRSRLEHLAAGGFDVASSRATFPLCEWLERSPKLVRPSARVIAFAAAPPPYGIPPPPAHLVQEVSYETGRGHGRWAGAYCCT